MKRTIGLAAAGLALLGATGISAPQDQKKVPSFSAQGSDGRIHTFESLTAGGRTLVLYFIQSTCPVNAEAMPFYKQIGTAYKGKKGVAFMGVIDEKEEGYIAWKKEFQNKFSVLYDDQLSIIRSYGAMASPWAVVVSPQGEVLAVHRGFSKDSLAELNALMAHAAGVPEAKIDLTGAPADMTYG